MSSSEGVSRNGSGEPHIRDDDFFENDPNAARFRDMAHALLSEPGATKEDVRKTLTEYGVDDSVLDRIFRTKEHSERSPQVQQLQQQAQGNPAGEGGSRERENEIREAALKLAEIREKGNMGSKFLKDLKKDGFTPEEIAQIDAAAGEPIKKNQRKQGSVSQPASQNNAGESEESDPDPAISAADTQHLRELMEKIIDTDALFTALREEGWQDEKIFKTISALKNSIAPEQSEVVAPTATPQAATPDAAAEKAERLRQQKEKEAIQDNAYWINREKDSGKKDEEISKKLADAGVPKETIDKTFVVANEIRAERDEIRIRKTATQVAHQWKDGVSTEQIEANLKKDGWREADLPKLFSAAIIKQRLWTYEDAASLSPVYEAPVLDRIKRSYDPVQKFLKRLSQDDKNNFRFEEARLHYRVAIDPQNRAVEWPATFAGNYHDYLRLCHGVPLRLLHPDIRVSEKYFLDRLNDPKDQLHSYKEEWEALWNSIRRTERGEFPPDEYARAVQRGEVPAIGDDFVIEKRKEKVPEEEIIAALKAAGWKEEDIPFVQSFADAKPLPEVFEGREFEMAKRYFDPLSKFLFSMSKKVGKKVFRIGDARLTYSVNLAPEKGGGKVEWKMTNYHDFLERLRSVPGADQGRLRTYILVEKKFNKRMADANDPLHAYKAEWEALVQRAWNPKSVEDELVDEYARSAWRGDVYLEVSQEAWEPLTQKDMAPEDWTPEVPEQFEDDMAPVELTEDALFDPYAESDDEQYVNVGEDESVMPADEATVTALAADSDVAIPPDASDSVEPPVEPALPSIWVPGVDRKDAHAQLEKLTAAEIEQLKKSYDPMFRLLQRMSQDPETNFTVEDAGFNYRVFMPARDEKGNISGKAETANSYHDLMELRASIPEELRKESDLLEWNWKSGGTWGKIAVFANGEIWDRINNPDDKLSKYRDEIHALINQVKAERLPDEYAEAIARGEINVQEIPEWNVYGAYLDLRAMYNDESIPDDIDQKYDSVYQKVREATHGSDEWRAASKEVRAFVQAQWDATKARRGVGTLDYDEWSRRINSFESQHRDVDLMRLFPDGKYPHGLSDRTYEYRDAFIKALNAGDEAKMAEITAAADVFFAEQRIAAAEAHKTPVEQKEIAFDEVEAIVREQLAGKAKINRLNIDPTPEGLQLHAELDAGMTGGKIVFDGTIVNDGNTIAIHGLDIDARGYVKSMIQDKLGEFDTAIKTYFEKKFGKQVAKMQIGDSGLTIELENPIAPIVSADEDITADSGGDAVPDIDSRAEGVGLLRKTVDAAKGKLYEAKEKVKWWKSAEEHLIRRSAELDAQAEKIGGIERLFRSMGEKYNKMPFKYKVALGATVGLGAIATAGSLAMALPLLGIAGQRIAGLSTMYLKYEKQYHDEAWKNNKDWGKQKALLMAGAYTVALGLTMKEAIELASQTELAHAAQAKVDGWLSSLYGNGSSVEAPKNPPPAPVPAPAPSAAPAAPAASAAASVASAPAVPQAAAPEVAVSQPAPTGTGTEGAAAPAQVAPPPEATPQPEASAGTKPTEAPAAQPAAAAAAAETASAGTPDVASIEVKATPGKGYEYMTKRLWEQLQEKNIKLPSGANPDSDLARLLAADNDSIDKVVHDLAQKNALFRDGGPSVRINLDSAMSIDTEGNILIDGAHMAPEDAPVTPAYQPEAAAHPATQGSGPVQDVPKVPAETSRVDAHSSLSERESMVPDRVAEGPAGVGGTTASEITVEQYPSPDIGTESQSPAPVVDRDFVVNKFDMAVPLAEPHIYAGPPDTNYVVAFGGEKMIRLNAMFDYLKTHPGSTVIAEDDSGKYRAAWTLVKDRLVQGERLPQTGFFARLSGALMPPPGPDELSKLIK